MCGVPIYYIHEIIMECVTWNPPRGSDRNGRGGNAPEMYYIDCLEEKITHTYLYI